MNKRKLGSFALCAMLLVLCFTLEAQQPTKVPRIGFLTDVSPPANSPRLEAFRQGLNDLGWTEAKKIAIDYRWSEGKAERLPALAPSWRRFTRT